MITKDDKMNMLPPPDLAGVQHRFVDVGAGVTIHVADAGPADGPVVMLVHGFPQNWWAWRHVIAPLAADGYRVLCPDLRGAGWSSAPRDGYFKTDMADDLAAVLDRLGVRQTTLVAHDWGGLVAFIMMLRHPDKVTGFFGINTAVPWITRDLHFVRHLWRFWYQLPIALPVLGSHMIADRKVRYLRTLFSWAGGGYPLPDEEVLFYARALQDKHHAVATSRWYRTFLRTEFWRWIGREHDNARVGVPVAWLHGTADPILTPTLLRACPERIDDFTVEYVDGVGHWIVEQRPELVANRLRMFLGANA